MSNLKPLQEPEFRAWGELVRRLTGIHLDEGKAYLVENRLAGLVVAEGLGSYTELYNRARMESAVPLRRKVIDAITTGETAFFRDQNPYEALRHKILPDLIDRYRRSWRGRGGGQLPVPIRIWSAACSTGQEVYSIAMVLREVLGDCSGYQLRLLGTDISDRAVAKASYGEFSNLEVERGLSPELRDRWLVSFRGGWRVRDELRAMATFRTANLMEDFSSVGRFDIVFCRNVAIYFREADRVTLFGRLARCLDPESYLVIGSTESIANMCPEFESKRYHRTVFYQIRNSRA